MSKPDWLEIEFRKGLAVVVLMVGCAKKDYKVYVRNFPTLQDCVDAAARQPRGGVCVIEEGSSITNEEISVVMPRDNAGILDERNGNVWMVLKPPPVSASKQKVGAR